MPMLTPGTEQGKADLSVVTPESVRSWLRLLIPEPEPELEGGRMDPDWDWLRVWEWRPGLFKIRLSTINSCEI